jgi:hypothetical protein
LNDRKNNMNTQTWMNGPPTRILLATDLSARSDRTLDRAVQLAGQWSSELVVLNVLEASPAPDMALAMIYGEEGVSNEQIVQRELQQDRPWRCGRVDPDYRCG